MLADSANFKPDVRRARLGCLSCGLSRLLLTQRMHVQKVKNRGSRLRQRKFSGAANFPRPVVQPCRSRLDSNRLFTAVGFNNRDADEAAACGVPFNVRLLRFATATINSGVEKAEARCVALKSGQSYKTKQR